jgi:hypothetical protein
MIDSSAWFILVSAEPLNLVFVVEYVGVPIETKAYASV